jgi:transcriptional regulator with XRE-family HTH domain
VTTPEDQQTEPVGARLKRLRQARGFSQRDLSSPGVSYAYISRIEAGARVPSVKALRKLARKLGVSVEYLETGRSLRDVDDRELRLADAELELRLAEDKRAAEEKISSILEEADEAGDARAVARAVAALGVAAAERGNYLEVVERLEAVLKDDSAAPSPQTDSTIYTTLGRAYSALGAPERAVRLFEQCLQDVEEASPDDVAIQIRYATFLSYALVDAGEYERAADVVREALARAGDDADPYTRVRLYWSLARLHVLEGRAMQALDNIRNAIALLEVTDDTLMLGRAHILAAGADIRRKDAADARTHLEQAEKLLAVSGQPADTAMIAIGRSGIAALEGKADEAVERARDALALLGDYHGGEQGTAVHALARGLALQGDEAAAGDAYRRAIDLLTVHSRRHDAAEAALEWGTFLRGWGRESDAETMLQRASDLGLKAEVEAARRR